MVTALFRLFSYQLPVLSTMFVVPVSDVVMWIRTTPAYERTR